MKKSLYLFMFIGLPHLHAQNNAIVVKKNMDNHPTILSGTINPSIVANSENNTIPLPETFVVEQNNAIVRNNTKTTLTNKRILAPKKSLIFKVIANGDTYTLVEDSSHFETLSEEIESAIKRVPKWLQYDLRFKFQEITNITHRTKMVSVLNATPKKYLDEVAFNITYLPISVLTSSSFINDMDYLIKDASLIYTYADSLKYVRIVESGDTNSGDWSTTTEYRIKQGADYIWRAIDKMYYYKYIAMPKIEQEILKVTDNSTSITAQRTWGYLWRDYLWNDYSEAVNTNDTEDRSYHNVNMCGYVAINSSGERDTVCIDTIPRLGELMQMPEYLWDEKTGIYFFNRPFSNTQGALNILGNWASRCIPQDVTSTDDYRPSQPNHIAWKHVGNCHEDALLIVAAARTALIPCIHVGDFCDDHVWAAIHDGGDDIWHHFEFFRGGLSANRPYYWGMTNLQPNGNYGWKSSLVQGFTPDATLINMSSIYSDDTPSILNITITDPEGNPVDGVRVNLYSANTQYGESKPYVRSAGYLWTDANGKISAQVGSGKKYYMKLYHPKFGTFPQTSGQVYVLIKSSLNNAAVNSVAGKSYDISFSFPKNASTSRHNISSLQTEYVSNKSVELTLNASNITIGDNPIDGGSSFYERTNNLAGLNIYAVDETNINAFKSGTLSGNAEYCFGSLAKGSFKVPVHNSGTTYIVVSNNNNYLNYIEVEYDAQMSDSTSFTEITGISTNSTPLQNMTIFPNPAQSKITISTENIENEEIFIYDITGKLLKKSYLTNGDCCIDIQHFAKGMYIIKCGNFIQKFVKQ